MSDEEELRRLGRIAVAAGSLDLIVHEILFALINPQHLGVGMTLVSGGRSDVSSNGSETSPSTRSKGTPPSLPISRNGPSALQRNSRIGTKRFTLAIGPARQWLWFVLGVMVGGLIGVVAMEVLAQGARAEAEHRGEELDRALRRAMGSV